jgi:hypothetical protein
LECLCAEGLAVEIQLLGKAIDPLNQSEVCAANKGELANVRRRRQKVKDEQLDILLENMLLKKRIVGDGLGVELLNVLK